MPSTSVPVTSMSGSKPLLHGIVLDKSLNYRPIMLCHGCGERITDYRLAMVSWTYGEFSFRLWHKVRPQCIARQEVPSMEMSDFLAWLTHGVNLRAPQEFREAVEMHVRAYESDG